MPLSLFALPVAIARHGHDPIEKRKKTKKKPIATPVRRLFSVADDIPFEVTPVRRGALPRRLVAQLASPPLSSPLLSSLGSSRTAAPLRPPPPLYQRRAMPLVIYIRPLEPARSCDFRACMHPFILVLPLLSLYLSLVIPARGICSGYIGR